MKNSSVINVRNYLFKKPMLKRHIAVVHEGQKNFLCDLCPKAFGTKNNLKNHKIHVHEGVKDFLC